MVLHYKLRPAKSKLVNQLNHQPNLIEKLINGGEDIQIPDALFPHIERLKIKC